MKNKFKIVLVLLVSLSFFACSTDDEGNTTSTGDLVGTWALTTFDYDGSITQTVQDQTTTVNFVGIGQNLDYTLTFSESPNEYVGAGSYDIELTTIFAGQSTTQVVPVENVFIEGTYSLDGNTLTVDGQIVDTSGLGVDSDVMGNSTIVQLTENTLAISAEQEQVQDFDGVSSTVIVSVVTIYTRL